MTSIDERKEMVERTCTRFCSIGFSQWGTTFPFGREKRQMTSDLSSVRRHKGSLLELSINVNCNHRISISV